MGRSGQAVAVVALALSGWAACSSYEGSEAPRGAADQECFENGTCFDGLVCFVGRCFSKDNFEAGASTSSSASSASSSSSGGSSTSSSGGPSSGSSGSSALVAARASCEQNLKCFPSSFPAEYASVEACASTTVSTAAPYPGIDPLCAVKANNAPCGEIATECLRGTLPVGAKCNFGAQCGSSICGKVAPADTCGTCKTAKVAGDPCGPPDYTCGLGLRCDFTLSKCVKPIAIDADCSAAADAFACAFGLACLSDVKKCGKPRQIGGACAPLSGNYSPDCRPGLSCKDQKCVDLAPTFKDVGATCAATDRCKGRSSCVNGKCTAHARKDEACAQDATAPFCDPYEGLTCTAGIGKCTTAQVCN